LNKIFRRGDIFIADIVESYPCVLKGRRPVVILSNYKACENSPLVNVVPITSNLKKLPSHVEIGVESGLSKSSIVVCEQIFTISKLNLIHFIGKCNYTTMSGIKKALDSQLGFSEDFEKEEHQREAKRMIRNIQELDRYLKTNFDNEIYTERQMALKCLENYLINHSLNVDISIFKNGWEIHGRREIS
jgi:mRNA interferase MazF